MKAYLTISWYIIFTIVLNSCSNDSEDIYPSPNTNRTIQTTNNQPTNPINQNHGLQLAGHPKSLIRYEYGIQTYWSQFYYTDDGNISKVVYKYSNDSGSEVLQDSYFYNSEGNLVKLYVGTPTVPYDTYNFYWDKDRIVKADRYNAPWSGNSNLKYDYNSNGEIIKSTEINTDFHYTSKFKYSYYDDGNLKTIDEYFGDDNTTEYPARTTQIAGYTTYTNLFPETAIIPGKIIQNLFPTSIYRLHLQSNTYEVNENYQYKLDEEGRVIEKNSGHNKVIYEYY
ncbi:hypothetical protein [Aegicerativicinus sediminis]